MDRHGINVPKNSPKSSLDHPGSRSGRGPNAGRWRPPPVVPRWALRRPPRTRTTWVDRPHPGPRVGAAEGNLSFWPWKTCCGVGRDGFFMVFRMVFDDLTLWTRMLVDALGMYFHVFDDWGLYGCFWWFGDLSGYVLNMLNGEITVRSFKSRKQIVDGFCCQQFTTNFEPHVLCVWMVQCVFRILLPLALIHGFSFTSVFPVICFKFFPCGSHVSFLLRLLLLLFPLLPLLPLLPPLLTRLTRLARLTLLHGFFFSSSSSISVSFSFSFCFSCSFLLLLLLLLLFAGDSAVDATNMVTVPTRCSAWAANNQPKGFARQPAFLFNACSATSRNNSWDKAGTHPYNGQKIQEGPRMPKPKTNKQNVDFTHRKSRTDREKSSKSGDLHWVKYGSYNNKGSMVPSYGWDCIPNVVLANGYTEWLTEGSYTSTSQVSNSPLPVF